MERKNGKATIMIAVLLLSMALMANASIGKIGETVRVGTESVDWWPMFHHDLTHTGYSTSTAPNTDNIIWSYTTGYGVWSSPAVADGKVYVGSGDYKVYCLDATTGALIWNYTTGYCVYSSPAVADSKVYVGSGDGKVYCLDATTGALIWNYTTGYCVYSSPAVADSKVYVGSYDHKVYCLDATTGALIWSYTTGYGVWSSPAVADGKVYVGSYDHKVYCLDATTGALIWNYTTGYWVLSSPAVADGKVYVGSGDGKVYCLDATTGAFIWSYQTGDRVESSPAIAYGKVYVGSLDGNVYCLDATTGAFIWSGQTGYWVDSSPAVADGKVYDGSWNGKVYCSTTTGALIWSYQTGGAVRSSPAVADGKVYVGSYDGKVYAFGPPHDVAIVNIAPSKTVVGQGYNMNVNVTVANQGDYAETFHVTLYADSGTPINETGLVGYWNFDEGAGTIAHDSSGNNNDGTIYGATWTSGKIGNALQFDGIDDSVRIPDSASLNIAGDKISITAWVKRLGSGTRNGIIVMKQAPPGAWDASYGVVIAEGVINTGKIGLSLDTGWGWTDHWSNSVLNSNEWYHFGGTYDGSKVRIYLNGVLDAEYDVTGNIVPKSGPLSIGHEDAWNPEYFNGLIDEVKVYNRSLSAEEIWAEYTRTGGRFAIGTQTVTLESGASTTLTFTWNTTGFAKGNYTIWAYAWPVPGETDIEDNALTDGLVIVAMIGDINADGKVDLKDVYAVAKAYGSFPNHPKWNPVCDINNDNKVDLKDYYIVCKNYGKVDP